MSKTAEKQLTKLDQSAARGIVAFQRQRLYVADAPYSMGVALNGSGSGVFWKYRIGDWRLIYSIRDQTMFCG